MAVYAIGDVQGCLQALQSLLRKIGFAAQRDQLWFVGDLVNRGRESLETLDFVRSLGSSARCVLGNHDFHLLRTYAGLSPPPSDGSFDAFLASHQRHGLVDWLRKQPLFHYDPGLNTAMVHAGLLASWSFTDAQKLSAEVETQLRMPAYRDFLAQFYGNKPEHWENGLRGVHRLRLIVNIMTRMRFQAEDGRLDFLNKGKPGSQANGLSPWFEYPHCRRADELLVVGHWSALGFMHRFGILAIDTGCVWRGRLSAVRLDSEDKKPISVPCEIQGRAPNPH